MAGKNKKSFDGWDNKDFFGGIFDFNRDGKTDVMEAMIGLQMLEDTNKEFDNPKHTNGNTKKGSIR